ncbi:MAG: type 1 glutamine amidotransferase domain-containing protein [Desulforegulaceae bacterium]|nr:type 1 glutamine amidotransferase domain-containing protein [Desulforegulaceae bacterium]
MELTGKKSIIFVEEQFNDQEFWYPYYRLLEAGSDVVICGSGRTSVFTGKAGTQVTADTDASTLNASDYDLLIIPGGFAPDFMRRSKEMVSFVSEMNLKNKIIASICHGGWMLVSAKILKNKKATSFFAIKDDMVNAGANWVDESVVVDSNLITSRTPDDLPAFMRTIIGKFKA